MELPVKMAPTALTVNGGRVELGVPVEPVELPVKMAPTALTVNGAHVELGVPVELPV